MNRYRSKLMTYGVPFCLALLTISVAMAAPPSLRLPVGGILIVLSYVVMRVNT